MENDIQKRQKTKAKTNDCNNLITATVIFGMPAKDCAYQGICRIEPEENFRENFGKCMGIADITRINENHFDFSFPKNKLNRKTIRKHFGSGYFTILEAYRAPEFLCQATGTKPLILLQGIYKVIENETHLRLEIKIATL